MKNNGSNLIKVGTAYVIGSFFSQGLRFLTLPLFSRLMSPADYGYIASYELWISILTTVIGIQTSATIANAYIDYGAERIDKYTSSVSSVGVGTFGICVIVIITCGKLLSDVFELNTVVLILGALQAIGFYFISMITAKYRMIDKVKNFLCFNIGCSSLSILGAFVCVYLSNDSKYLGYILGFFIANFAIGLIAAGIIYFRGRAFINNDMVNYAVKLSSPLLLHSIASVISSRINQILLLKMVDATNAGIYNFTNNFALITTGLYTAFNQAYVPWYYKQLHKGNRETVKLASNVYISMFTLIVTCIIMIMPETIKIMGTEEYYFSMNIVPLLLFGTYINFLYTFPVNYEFYKKKTIYIAMGTVIAAICNIVLNIIMINSYGIMGASVAIGVAAIILLAFHYVIAKNIIKGFELEVVTFIKNIAIVLGFIIIYYILMDKLIIRIGIVVLIVATFFYRALKLFKLLKNN